MVTGRLLWIELSINRRLMVGYPIDLPGSVKFGEFLKT